MSHHRQNRSSPAEGPWPRSEGEEIHRLYGNKITLCTTLRPLPDFMGPYTDVPLVSTTSNIFSISFRACLPVFRPGRP